MGKTIIVNGRIHTMDKYNTIAEAVVIQDEKIVYIGDDREAKKYIDKNTELIDAAKNVILPGFIEAHVHMPGNAYNVLYNINLFDAKTMDETLDIIRKFVKDNPDRNLYYGRGFMSTVFPGIESSYGPRKERLDEICPDKPMIINDYGGHVIWLNSAAFSAYGITKDTPDIEGGVIEKDPDTGELWGTLKEEAKTLYPDPEYTIEEEMQAVAWCQDMLNAYGYTSIFSLRPSCWKEPSPIYEAMEALQRQDKLHLRIVGAREIKVNMDENQQIEEAAKQSKRYNRGQIKAKTAKYFIDGTVEGISAFLSEPYLTKAGKGDTYCGESLWETERLKAAFVKTFESGLNIHIHAIGDAAVSQAIDALEYAQKKVPIDHRNTITHLQLVKDEDIKRMADAGIIACCNVHWHLKDPSVFFEAELPFLGEERANNEYPLKRFLDAGVCITSSGDIPITPYPNPFYAIQIGVTRNLVNADFFQVDPITDIEDPRWLLNKSERVSVQDMVKSYTINAAYANYLDDEVGSIELGKYGDLIIIDRDIFHINPLEIENTKVVRTIFAGKTIYTT